MVKRKRESTGPSEALDSGAKTPDENPDQESSSSAVGRERKRRKLSSTKSSDPADICAELYELIRNYRTDDGRVLCEALIRVPKRRTSPEYYEVVSSPIDLLKIQQRLKTDEYEDVETFVQDVELLLDNAMKFYKPDTQEYKDAVELKEIFEEEKESLLSGNKDEESDDAEEKDDDDKTGPGYKQIKKESGDDDDNESSSTDGEYFEDMLGAILEQKDGHGRIICELFKRLPPKDLYPEYYEVIKEPIDLKTICTRVRSHYYSTVEDLEKDLQVMVKNAHAFNEPGSQVYKDASTIKKLIQTKKAEIEHTVMGAKSSSRLKARRSTGQLSLALTALLEEEDDQAMYQAEPMQEDQYEDSPQADDDAGGDDDSDNPLMMLFNDIYKYTDVTGRLMIEPFLRLPSRRAYPDYYEVITKPIAMMKIRSQIKSGYYESVEALDYDMELCFSNAQTYNEPNSMLFKDAERMLEQLKRKTADINKMIQEKSINLEDFLKKKKRVKKSVDSADSPSVEDTSFEVPKPQPVEVKQIKEMKIKKKVSADGKPKKKKTDDVDPMVLKKRMRQLAKAVLNYQDETGRYLCAIFMDLPSSEEYPDYYKVISEPVCLSQIETNVRDNKYSAEEELLLDFEVMFDNARYYNEEDSQVYQDACVLEKVLKKKRKALGPIHPVTSEPGPSGGPTPVPRMITPTKSGRISSSPGAARKYYQVPSATSELKELCKELLTAVKDCTDMGGRQLCLIFQKLPSRTEYPDYYTLIKKPIDMAKIQSKLNGDQYQTLDDFMSDFHLMFDNACRYNEPDSQVYKDSLTLLRALLRKKAELVGDENKIPHVPFLAQKILNILYDATIKHVDDEGRCFSDSLVELSVKHGGNTITLESIGETLKRGYYRRLDKLQEDLFAIFEKARKISRSDCETYDDAVELQVHFVHQRDKLCKDGERFISPALLITRRHLVQELDDERKKKAELEGQEDEKLKAKEKKEGKDDTIASDNKSGVKELFLGETKYSVGDFVYIEPREDKLQPHVVLVEKLWTDTSGEKWLYGNWYYRPKETFHLANRKFLEKEVFKSDYSSPSKLRKVLGKCYVMTVKDYLKQKPEDFKDVDVYVCESRYSVRTKSFKKIKIWPSQTTNVTMVTREVVLTPKRVPSVFAPNVQQKPVVMDTDDGDDSETDSKKNVTLDNTTNDGCVHFEQYCLGDIPYKLGDCVYLRSDEDYLYIARIDRLWTDRNGNNWLHGPWFIGPGETQHLPTKMFHEQEVFLSSLEETSPLNSIVGKCMVLSIRDYTRCRSTEIAEKDIYLNEARYDEEEGQFRKLKGLKRYSLSLTCYEEEFYYFEESINPLKVPSPLLFEDQDMMAAGDRSVSPSTSLDSVDSGKKQKKPRSQSAYLLFAYEKRLSLRREHPEYVFGEISRVIGEEWRNASTTLKAEYEAKAQLQLSQTDNENAHRSQSSTSMFVYDCCWRGCDYQYEDLQDLRVHVLDSSNHLKKADDGLYHCFWTTCTRERRGFRPFNSSAKLFRHCREVHLIGPPRIVAPHDRSKNYFPRHQAPIIDGESDTSPPPPRVATPSGTPASSMGLSSGGMGGAMIGMSQNVTPAMQGPYQQPGNVQTPNQYMAGRVTPQAMQQGVMYSGSTNTVNTPYNQQPMQQNSTMLQRQMAGNVGMNLNIPNQNIQQQQTGQSPGYQQPFNQTQQFNFQQQINPMNPMGQISPSTPQAPQAMNPLQQINQMNQYQTQSSSQHQQPTQTQVAPAQHIQTQAPAQPPVALPEVPTPIFVAPPSKPQRLHHSEAYLRYIEGLRDGNPHMSNWSQSRKPDPSTMTPQQIAQLPVHWLGNGYGDYDNPVDALWALKEHMMRDALSLSRTGEN